MKLMHITIALVIASLFGAGSSFAVKRLDDTQKGKDKFSLMSAKCLNMAVEKGIEKLSYENAEGVGLTLSGGYGGASGGIGFNIPRGGLNKKNNPGDGICCTFNDKGKILTVHRTNEGDRECGAKVRTTRNALGAGLWWCTGPQGNCQFDWWYIEP